MRSLARLPARFPVGSKYILESCGQVVRRYVEFPNGRKVKLATRKALPCNCWKLQQVSIVPDLVNTPTTSKKPEPEHALKGAGDVSHNFSAA